MNTLRSRIKIITVISCLIIIFILLFLTLGYYETWELLGTDIFEPYFYFLDLRSITHGAQSVKHGLNPMLENPSDPFCRPLTYPSAWKVLYYFGVNESHTLPIGLTLYCILSDSEYV